MQQIPRPFRVFIGLLPSGYLNTQAIDEVIRAGITFCGLNGKIQKLRPGASIVVRPDVTLAHPVIARHAYTHPDITRGVLSDVLSLAPSARMTILGETLPGLPATRIFKRAHGQSEAFLARGYHELENLFPGRIDVLPVDEAEHYRYQLSKGNIGLSSEAGKNLSNRITNEISAPSEYFDADFVIVVPKLKSNMTSHGFSGAIRLGAPSLRGFDADQYFCDLLEVNNPDLVVSDGIIAAIGGNAITQRGHELGVMLVANNALAHDWIAAKILNLDPMKIGHLKAAAERGWGPTGIGQIELGGAGADGVAQLEQKSHFWDIGLLPVQEFGKKFERENPGQTFPLEILTNGQEDVAGPQGAFLDWLYLTYDSPAQRQTIGRWPKCSVCLGEVKIFPSNFVIYAIGDQALRGLKRLTSTSRVLLNLRACRIISAQLKNGRRHLIIEVPGLTPRLRDQTLAFAIGSLGRMLATQAFRGSIVTDRIFDRVRSWWLGIPQKDERARIVMTSRIARNAWWALKPVRPHLKESVKEPAAPEAFFP